VNQVNSVTVCSILPNGNLTCGDPTGSNFAAPAAIAISPDGTKAYVTNFNNSGFVGTVTVCSISGFDLTCSMPTESNLFQPWGIALSPDGSIAYVANPSGGYITACQVSGDNLINCQKIVQDITSVTGVAISPDGFTAYLTIPFYNAITICNVSDYTMNCGPKLNPNSTLLNPQLLTVSRDGTQLFVVDSGYKVTVCSISDQGLASCNITGSNFDSPNGIAVY
jgi:DNA-binding beta-propeller fold protein YncE